MPKSMPTDVASPSRRRPWHLWVVGVAFVLLYAAGAYDYLMLLRLDEGYIAAQNFDAHQIAYFAEYPLITRVFWTIGIASGLIAPVMLMMRSRWSVSVAFIAATSQACLALITFGAMNRWEVLGPRLALFDLTILLLTFGFFGYCRRLSTLGVLD